MGCAGVGTQRHGDPAIAHGLLLLLRLAECIAQFQAQPEVAGITALGRTQQRHRIGPAVYQQRSERYQHLRRQFAQLGPVVPQGVVGQRLQRLAIPPHGRIAEAVPPRVRVGTARHPEQPRPRFWLLRHGGPVVQRRDQWPRHPRVTDPRRHCRLVVAHFPQAGLPERRRVVALGRPGIKLALDNRRAALADGVQPVDQPQLGLATSSRWRRSSGPVSPSTRRACSSTAAASRQRACWRNAAAFSRADSTVSCCRA